jgi:hypothetical protein
MALVVLEWYQTAGVARQWLGPAMPLELPQQNSQQRLICLLTSFQ